MDMMTMYMLTRLDPFRTFFSIACILSATGAICSVGMDEWEEMRRVFKCSVIAFVISTCGVVLIPSTKEMAAIIVVPKIVNSTTVQKDVPELYSLGVEWLKEKLTTESR